MKNLDKNAKEQPVSVSIRPEEFVIMDKGEGVLKGVGEHSTFLGLNTHYHVRLQTGEKIEIVQESSIEDTIEAGAEISLGIKTAKINVFTEDGAVSLIDKGGPS